MRNVLTLHLKHPQPGKGWGCFVCGLPSDGAIAVVCGKCLGEIESGKTELKFACAGWAAEPGRIPVKELKGEHDHNQALHKAETN